jgi:protein gp37
MKNSEIAWTDHTFNPWRGCSGERCLLAAKGLCYAENMETARGRDFLKIIPTAPANWQQVFKWEAEAAGHGVAYRVFCGSLMDFNDRKADMWRGDVWPIIRRTPHLVWLLLSKNPERYQETLPSDWKDGYQNAWLGASALNAEQCRRNANALRAVPAVKRTLSLEPLMGRIPNPDFTDIAQVFVGGCSGPQWKDYVMPMEWAVELYHAAKAKGVAFFFKQVSARRDEQGADEIGRALDGTPRIIQEVPDGPYPWGAITNGGKDGN